MRRHAFFASLADARDDAATTILQYALAPSQVFVALTQSLTLTITNGTPNPVSLDANDNDEIDVTFPVSPPASEADGLVDAATFTASQPTGWSVGAGLQSNVWRIVPSGKQTLGPGVSLTVTFSNIAVNATQGTPTILVTEYIGSSTGTYNLSVTKIAQSLNVIAWPVPYQVGLGQVFVLNWASVGGTSVVVNGLPTATGSQTFKITTPPPSPGYLNIVLKPTDPNRSFPVVVYKSSGEHAQTTAGPVTQMSPLITQFGAVTAPPDPIPAGQSVALQWTILFAATAYLARPDGTNRAVQPIQQKPLTVTPAADVLTGAHGNYTNLPTSAMYSLQANGYGTSAVQPLEFPLAGANLLYLKFASPPGTAGSPAVMFALDDPAWTATQQTGGGSSYSDVTVATVYQPGGTSDVYYLGTGDTTHPQIQYFNATQSGNTWTLTWVTQNLTALVLDPNPGAPITTQAQINSGSITVTPTATTTYVLTGTGGTPATTITSSLDVTIT